MKGVLKLKKIIMVIITFVFAVSITSCGVSKKTVFLETNGGSIAERNIDVDKFGFIPKPFDPTKKDHIFVGWYYDDEFSEEVDFTQPLTNSTIYAKWTTETEINLEDLDDLGGLGKYIKVNIEWISGKYQQPDGIKYSTTEHHYVQISKSSFSFQTGSGYGIYYLDDMKVVYKNGYYRVSGSKVTSRQSDGFTISTAGTSLYEANINGKTYFYGAETKSYWTLYWHTYYVKIDELDILLPVLIEDFSSYSY